MITYLIHFDKPLGSGRYGQAQHYLGSTIDLQRRLRQHKCCHGSRIMTTVIKSGIDWHVVRTWESDSREKESQLKRRKNNRKLCPICNRKG